MLEKLVTLVGALVIVVALVVLMGAILALPVMWLWNGVVVDLFAAGAVRPVGFWSAWGLLILCGLLFKSSVSKQSDN